MLHSMKRYSVEINVNQGEIDYEKEDYGVFCDCDDVLVSVRNDAGLCGTLTIAIVCVILISQECLLCGKWRISEKSVTFGVLI